MRLRAEYDSKLSEYATLERVTMEGTRGLVKTNNTPSSYANNNVRLTDGTIGYVTNNGVCKPYPSSATASAIMGNGNCPQTTMTLDISSPSSLDEGTIIGSDPTLVVGTPMKVGQVCGDFGRNVEVGTNPDRAASYLGMSAYSPANEGGMEYQSDINVPEALVYGACRQRAIDMGAEAFGLGDIDGGAKCVVGPTPSLPPGAGLRVEKGYSVTAPATISRFGLGPGATSLTAYGNDGSKVWSSFEKPGCTSSTGGSLIGDVSASYGTNCNGKTTQQAAFDGLLKQIQENPNANPCTIL
jgi:hypothetical protein